mgnify:CR=1 FL=1
MERDRNTFHIRLDKTKIILLLIGCSIFSFLGFWFFSNLDFTGVSSNNFPFHIRILGLLTMVFSCIAGFFWARKAIDVKDGLKIDESGITDNSSAISIGHIPCEEITGFETTQVASTKFISIYLKDPLKYIQKAKGSLIRKVMKANYKYYGTPIAINPTSLKIQLSELEKLIEDEWAKRDSK